MLCCYLIIFLSSHYWVVVIRLGSPADFDQTADPSDVYPDNSRFTNYSSSVPADTPYVAAEISSANYQPSMTFVLGDEKATMSINDFPDLYRNGPLQQGSTYTAFVRAFAVGVPVGMCVYVCHLLLVVPSSLCVCVHVCVCVCVHNVCHFIFTGWCEDEKTVISSAASIQSVSVKLFSDTDYNHDSPKWGSCRDWGKCGWSCWIGDVTECCHSYLCGCCNVSNKKKGEQ